MKPVFTLFITALLIITGSYVHAQRITVTVVGEGVPGVSSFNGDGNPGIGTRLTGPYSVCIDAAHNVYFTDIGRIRKLSAKYGTVSTIAGGGTLTIFGVPATSVALSPGYICTDAAGNIYVSSSTQVERIDATTNIITKVAGTGAKGYSGDGGPATNATFGALVGICIDKAENIYVVDKGNNCVREVAAGTGIITTIAGTGVSGYTGDGGPAIAAKLSDPDYISVDTADNVFIVDHGDYYVRKISAATGIISTIAGGSGPIYNTPATNTALGSVTGFCSDQSGNLFFNEFSCSCREIDLVTDSTYAVGGNFGIESFRNDTNSNYSWMNEPYGLCADEADNIYVADAGNNRVRKLIQLTHVPTFALGEGQTIAPCTGLAFSINTQMAITDIDFGQPETWTVLSAPANGTLSGFPYTKMSSGTDSIALPTGLSYIPGIGFSGADSFVVRVTDGTFSDTVIVYVSVSSPPPGGSITSKSGPAICGGSLGDFSETISGGIWGITNRDATIDSITGTVTTAYLGLDTVLYTPPVSRCKIVDSFVVAIITIPSSGGVITGKDSVCIGSSIVLADTTSGGVWSAVNANASIAGTGLVTGLLPGTDVINYSVANKCGTATSSRYIIIDSTAITGAIAGSDHVCVAAAITLSDTIAGGIWSVTNGNTTVSGAGMVTGVSLGIDTVVYALSNACGTSTTTATVIVNPLPHVGAITGDSTVCTGATIFLNDTAADGGWTQVNGHGMISSSGAYAGLTAGVDTVYFSVYNSCGAAYTTQKITVTNCMALGNITYPTPDLKIYPNPALSTLNIEWTNWTPTNTVVVSDVTGRMVSSNEFDNSNGTGIMQVDVSNLVAGVYFVKINGTEVRKFVKE